MKKFIFAFLALAFLGTNGLNAATATPFNTYAMSVAGSWVYTRQAYQPAGIITHPQLNSPQDLHIDANGNLYIADSGGRILVFDSRQNFITIIGEETLNSPTGVTVDLYGNIFVADGDFVQVFSPFSDGGVHTNSFGRPDSVLFGTTEPFRPLKLDINPHEVLFIVGEAAHNGLIMLNQDGEFLGYFGANQVNLTLFQTLQNIFTPRDQRLFLNVPLPPTNLAIDSRGTVFTVTQGLAVDTIKKLNVAGNNIAGNIETYVNIIDVALANHGGFFALDISGRIFEYNAEGFPIFAFGITDPAVQRMGVFLIPSAIVQDAASNLFVADSAAGFVHIFAPTDFAASVHTAMAYFDLGMYVESMAYWSEVLRFHSGFSLANMAIGHARFLQEDFNAARESFFVAGYRNGYSEAFWELRNEWVLLNAGPLSLGFVAFWLILKGFGKISRKPQNSHKTTKAAQLAQELLHFRKVLKNPPDAFYEIRFHKKASVLSATIIYAALILAYLLSLVGRGFIFEQTFFFFSIPTMLLMFVGVVALFVVMNYLVATINEGEGSLKNVYICTAYATVPFILLSVPAVILSQILTLNESFVFDFVVQVSIGWSLVLVFLMAKELHDYEIGATVKNLILTVSASTVLVVTVFVMYLLLEQLFNFVQNILLEFAARF
ncbi:MAG: YIP1 family protein [Defluviitaleaceae bacterium]|nr:YIP1 family protein [Defluviitaleaceae bacterium]